MMVIEGNHEIEPQAAGISFQSYLTRFAVPSKESGSNTNFYYSFDAGGVHFIMLVKYTGAQYAWLKEDLHNMDRSVTPWLVAAWHPPWNQDEENSNGIKYTWCGCLICALYLQKRRRARRSARRAID
ncbi:hypothetical protein CsSME_00033910 [Camellia sinensis var. sinensis]